MVGKSCVMVEGEMPLSVLLSLEKYMCPVVPDGFTFHFTLDILPYRTQWINSFKRTYQSVDCSEIMWIVCSEITDGVVYREYGFHFSRAGASDISLRRLAYRLLKANPGYFLPRYLIGYPNIRGHCFLIAVVLPLLHSYPFLAILAHRRRLLTIDRNCPKSALNIKGKSFDLVEKPFYWCDLLHGLHMNYFKIAHKGGYSQENEPLLMQRVCRNLSPVLRPKYVRPKEDLWLDNALIRGLCASLRNFCNGNYSESGGDERFAYRHLLGKLASEEPLFYDHLYLNLAVTYTCSCCSGGPWKTVYRLPFLVVHCDSDFQEELMNFSKCLMKQDLRCDRVLNGSICGGSIHLLSGFEILKVPKVLCFVTQDVDKFGQILPNLCLDVQDQVYSYTLFSCSKSFECWKDSEDRSYGEFYHKYVEGDVSEGWHTYPIIRTSNVGYTEINNGILYRPDVKIQWRTTPATLHLYQLSNFDEFVPLVDTQYLKNNPNNVNK